MLPEILCPDKILRGLNLNASSKTHDKQARCGINVKWKGKEGMLRLNIDDRILL